MEGLETVGVAKFWRGMRWLSSHLRVHDGGVHGKVGYGHYFGDECFLSRYD